MARASSRRALTGEQAIIGYGEDRARGLVIQRLSEEHGVAEFGEQTVSVGERVRIIPNHACTVANLAEVLIGVRGERVTEVMKVLVRGGGK